MKNAENVGSCPQRDSTECEGYAGAQSAVQPGSGETAGKSPKLLEAILYRDNMNNAYKRVKANKGAPGVDGMTVEEALPWLKLWFCTNNQKDVYKDLQQNPYTELCVSSPAYAWIRLNGKAVFENNRAVKEMCIANPIVKSQYQTADNPIF